MLNKLKVISNPNFLITRKSLKGKMRFSTEKKTEENKKIDKSKINKALTVLKRNLKLYRKMRKINLKGLIKMKKI